MANCLDNIYTISFTDTTKATISIPRGGLLTDEMDIALVGKKRLEYGEIFNENVLHLLENFACPEDPLNIGNPDLDVAYAELLQRPIDGQFWYNKTDSHLYFYDADDEVWIKLSNGDEVAGNHGFIYDGQSLPNPVHPRTGYVFPYSECSWHVAPAVITAATDYLECYTDSEALVTMKYRAEGTSVIVSGFAFYQIIGIKDNNNLGLIPSTTPVVPTPTPAATTPIISPSVTPTITPTITPTVSVSSSAGAGLTPTPTPTRTTTPTRTPTSTPIPGVTPSPTASNTPVPSPTRTRTPNPSVTPSITPTMTPTPSTVITVDFSDIPSEISKVQALTPAAVYLGFMSNGTWYIDKAPGSSGDASGNYLSGATNGSDYEIRYVYNVSPNGYDYLPVSSMTAGTWNTISSTKIFSVTNSETGDPLENYANITITIRHKVNTTNSKSFTVFMSADGECFAVGTKLLTSNGYVEVEKLAIGDSVVSFTEQTMLPVTNDAWRDWKTSSIETIDHTSSTISKITRFSAASCISINGVVSTLDHVYFAELNGEYMWVNASMLTQSHNLIDRNMQLVPVIDIRVINETTEFVGLIASNHNTLVVQSRYGDILVHNSSA